MEPIYTLLKFVMGTVVVGIFLNFVGNYLSAKMSEAGKKLHDLELAMVRVEEIVKNNATQAGVIQLRADIQKDLFAEIQGNDSKLRDFIQVALSNQTKEVNEKSEKIEAEIKGETQNLINGHKKLCELERAA